MKAGQNSLRKTPKNAKEQETKSKYRSLGKPKKPQRGEPHGSKGTTKW
jgi:hypothetical protein